MKKLILIIAVFGALGAMAWLGLRSKPASGRLTAEVASGETAGSSVPEQTRHTPRIFRPRERANADGTNAMAVWDRQIDAVLASSGTAAEIADTLLELYPRVPAEGQADLAMEIAAHISNENYGKLAGLITNSTSSEAVLETLLTDLMDRPDKIRLPLLLDMARSKENAKAPDAHELLEALLGEDYGEDWNLWSKKISEWLASHPE